MQIQLFSGSGHSRLVVTVRLAQKNFSGGNRPTAQIILDIMETLSKDGLSTIEKVGLSQVLLKKITMCCDGRTVKEV